MLDGRLTMKKWTRTTALVIAACALAVCGGGPVTASNGAQPPRLEFLGQAIVPTGETFGGTTIGGLSSITYDAASGDFYVLSDDQADARFYTVRIDVGDGRLDNGDVRFTGVTTLLAPDGSPYPRASLDPEGLTLAKSGELIVTSEGFAARQVAPWVRRYSRDGRYLGDLPVPRYFEPTATRGVRQNLAFEAAAVSPDGRHLFVGMEGALVQDGPPAAVSNGSSSRILRYNLSSGRLDRENVYLTEPLAEPPVPPTAFGVNGLVELLPFNTQFMIAMERSFSVGAPGTGNKIRLYWAALPGADDVKGIDSLSGLTKRVVAKTLLIDLDVLGLPLDNVEGMVLGPNLPDGRQSLVLVSDNNFAASQFTQFLMFAIW
jgi:hypothetical protein